MQTYTVELQNSNILANGDTFSPECLQQLTRDINKAFTIGTEFPPDVKRVFVGGVAVFQDGKVILKDATIGNTCKN